MSKGIVVGSRGPERKLTAEHVQVLAAIANGMTNRQIAEMTEWSLDRVRDQLRIIFKFLGAENRTQAAILAMDYGILKPDGTPDGTGEQRRRAAASRIGEIAHLTPAVLDLCQLLHLRVAHFRPALRADGTWRTPVEGNAEGFPDIVVVGTTVIWRELKTLGRKPTRKQLEWITDLRAAGQDADVWTGEDLLSGRVERELKAITKRTKR
jgi:DNA-binding CsgD family transcriptional regulator